MTNFLKTSTINIHIKRFLELHEQDFWQWASSICKNAANCEILYKSKRTCSKAVL